MKILFLVNFNVEYDWELWQKNGISECPPQYLWGITHLQQHGIEVEVLPFEKFRFLKKLGYFLRLGDLDQQLRVLLHHTRYDLIYCASQTDTVLLGLLRCLGIFRRPIVVKLERPFKVNLLSRLLVKVFALGHAKLLCLGERTRNQLRDEFNLPIEKIPLLEWGADLVYYDQKQKNAKLQPELVLSAGSTSRDFDTLVSAFDRVDYPLRIYCSGKAAPKVNPLPHNVTVQHGHPVEKRALSHDELLAEYSKAYAVAIPLHIPEQRKDTTTLIGLTSLLEAMVMGKATVMTKHRQVNIDVEQEGIGLWVEPGDVEGWKRAIFHLLENPEETAAMGIRARRLCENRYNLNSFAAQLAKELKGSLGKASTKTSNATVGSSGQ